MRGLDRLIAFYENEGEEELRLREGGAHYLEYLTAMELLGSCLPSGCRVLDSCAGSGVYAFALAERGYGVTAGDIVPRNVALIRERQAREPLLEAVYEGDALDLSRFEDGSFGAVLCMGALYHLQEAADRRRAVAEAGRVLGPEGILAITYMNRHAVILNNSRGSLDNIDEILEFAAHGREGVFYASAPGEMEALLREEGLALLCHAALDGVSNFLHGTAGLLDDEGLARWRRYHAATCREPSLLGYSYHNMIIAKKGGSCG